MSRNTKYPEIKVRLTGTDCNAFAVIGAVTHALRRAHVSETERAQFQTEATSCDYDNVLATAMRWVNVS